MIPPLEKLFNNRYQDQLRESIRNFNIDQINLDTNELIAIKTRIIRIPFCCEIAEIFFLAKNNPSIPRLQKLFFDAQYFFDGRTSNGASIHMRPYYMMLLHPYILQVETLKSSQLFVYPFIPL